jgi:hypothetical protein
MGSEESFLDEFVEMKGREFARDPNRLSGLVATDRPALVADEQVHLPAQVVAKGLDRLESLFEIWHGLNLTLKLFSGRSPSIGVLLDTEEPDVGFGQTFGGREMNATTDPTLLGYRDLPMSFAVARCRKDETWRTPQGEAS